MYRVQDIRFRDNPWQGLRFGVVGLGYRVQDFAIPGRL